MCSINCHIFNISVVAAEFGNDGEKSHADNVPAVSRDDDNGFLIFNNIAELFKRHGFISGWIMHKLLQEIINVLKNRRRGFFKFGYVHTWHQYYSLDCSATMPR